MREVSLLMREGVGSLLSNTSLFSFVGVDKVKLLVKWYVDACITLIYGGGCSLLLFCRSEFDRMTVRGASLFGEMVDELYEGLDDEEG